MIPISKPYIGQQEINAVVKVLRSGQIAQGPRTVELEKKFTKLCGSKYAIAVTNGTAALHLALHAIGIRPGDEVVTTPFTFIATANAILMAGGVPVFVDIDEETYNIDPKQIEKAITKKTKAIVAVDLYGQPADYQEINALAKKYQLYVVEDAAQSINADYKNKKTGNLTDVASFSFYATKNITCGEGGMVTMSNREVYDRAVLFRNHGMPPGKRYTYIGLGYNYRISDIMSVILMEQLKRLDKITAKRQAIAEQYNKAFNTLKSVKIPSVKKKRSHGYHQYTLQLTEQSSLSRDQLINYLLKHDIQANIYYPQPLYEIDHLKKFNSKAQSFPVTEKAVKSVVSIPIYPELSAKDQLYIQKTIIKALS